MCFTFDYLISPTNPIEINLIGADGTGLKGADRFNGNEPYLTDLGQAGLQVHLWDDDIITESNFGRQ